MSQRTAEKNGYTALQLGAGTRKPSRLTKAERGKFAVAKVEPEAQACRVPRQPGEPDRRRRRDHGRPLRPRPVRRRDRHHPGQGLPGRHEALELRRPARHARRLGHRTARHGSTGQRQDPGKVFKGKKMAGHMGDERVTTQNLVVVKIDVERGLLMIRGAVPGSKGGWVDRARRRQEGGAHRCAEARRSSSAAEQEGERRDESSTSPRSKPRRPARSSSPTPSTGWSRAGHPAAHGALPAPEAHGRHASRPGPLGSDGHGQEDVQAEGHRRRPSRRQVGAAVARRRQGVRPQAAQPCHRPAQEGARAGAASRALRQGQGRRDRRARQGSAATARPKSLLKTVRQARARQRADHRRRGARSWTSLARPATFRTSTCCRSRASTSTTSCAARSWC